MTDQPTSPAGPKMPGMHIPPDLDVEYANLVRIAHSPSELVFDFAHLFPGGGQAQISSRIIMSPLGAKLFQRALTENLAKYEAAFGPINLPGDVTLADHLFKPPSPPNRPDKPDKPE